MHARRNQEYIGYTKTKSTTPKLVFEFIVWTMNAFK